MIVTLQDCTEVLYCRKGIRAFFKKYKLDYSDFVANGIEEEKLLALNDSMANKVLESARGRKQ